MTFYYYLTEKVNKIFICVLESCGASRAACHARPQLINFFQLKALI